MIGSQPSASAARVKALRCSLYEASNEATITPMVKLQMRVGPAEPAAPVIAQHTGAGAPGHGDDPVIGELAVGGPHRVHVHTELCCEIRHRRQPAAGGQAPGRHLPADLPGDLGRQRHTAGRLDADHHRVAIRAPDSAGSRRARSGSIVGAIAVHDPVALRDTLTTIRAILGFTIRDHVDKTTLERFGSMRAGPRPGPCDPRGV